MLSYDIGIGIGSLLMGFMQESIGLTTGFALTAVAYVVGGIVYIAYSDGYYRKLRKSSQQSAQPDKRLLEYIERDVYTLPDTATVRDTIVYFSDKHISGAPIVSQSGSVVGYLSDGDMIRYLHTDDHQPAVVDSSARFMDYFWNPDAEFQQKLNSIMDRNVLEIGSRHPITIGANASLEEVCKLLSEKGVKKVPVVDGGKIVGILSRSAVTHYLPSATWPGRLYNNLLDNRKSPESVLFNRNSPGLFIFLLPLGKFRYIGVYLR